MNFQPLIDTSLRSLDAILIHDLGATTDRFATRAEEVAATLPDEAAQALRAIAAQQASLLAAGANDPQQVGEFCFAAGALHEKLRTLLQTEMELESAIVGPDRVSATPLQRAQSDQLARLLETRDRIFRKVADVTLKFLLIGLGLLVLGLVLGLV